jgi:hypothetical protein
MPNSLAEFTCVRCRSCAACKALSRSRSLAVILNSLASRTSHLAKLLDILTLGTLYTRRYIHSSCLTELVSV